MLGRREGEVEVEIVEIWVVLVAGGLTGGGGAAGGGDGGGVHGLMEVFDCGGGVVAGEGGCWS